MANMPALQARKPSSPLMHAPRAVWRANFGSRPELASDDFHEYARHLAGKNRARMALFYVSLEIKCLEKWHNECGNGEVMGIANRLYLSYCNAAALCIALNTEKKLGKAIGYCGKAASIIAKTDLPSREKKVSVGKLLEATVRACYLTGRFEEARGIVDDALNFFAGSVSDVEVHQRHAKLSFIAGELFMEGVEGHIMPSEAPLYYKSAISSIRILRNSGMALDANLRHIQYQSSKMIEEIESYQGKYSEAMDKHDKECTEYMDRAESEPSKAKMAFAPIRIGGPIRPFGLNGRHRAYPEFVAPERPKPDKSIEKLAILLEFPNVGQF